MWEWVNSLDTYAGVSDFPIIVRNFVIYVVSISCSNFFMEHSPVGNITLLSNQSNHLCLQANGISILSMFNLIARHGWLSGERVGLMIWWL